jgi:hypothetical protein
MVSHHVFLPNGLTRAIVVMAALGSLDCTGSSRDAADTSRSAGGPNTSAAGDVAAPWMVTPRGVGPVRVGMLASEASAALRKPLVMPNEATAGGHCTYATWQGAPAGVTLMIENGRVERVDVDSATIPTAAGVRVGDSEESVRSAYAERVTTTPHKYDPSGHNLTVTPASTADSMFRIVFETNGQRVMRFRAGRLPAVQYVEGCG